MRRVEDPVLMFAGPECSSERRGHQERERWLGHGP